MQSEHTAILSNSGKYSMFSFNGLDIRFRTSPRLVKYVKIKEWDNGYLVVDADYSTLGIVEEYIDLSNILNELFIDKRSFLSPIKEVVIKNDKH